MTLKADIEGFLAQKKLALAGASRGRRKFGNNIFKELKNKGYQVFLIHPSAELIDGQPCYRDCGSLPDEVGGLIIAVRPAQTEKAVESAARAGIKRIWMQRGAESPKAIRLCRANGITVIHNECVLMFAEPAALIHRVHRLIWKLIGKLPAS
ncbi:CoA-binding protein [Fibrobacterota bacterium]